MALGASTTTNVPELLKSIWDDEVQDYQYEDEVFYGKIEKDTGWDGISQIITCKIGNGGGHSAKFGNAKANKGPSTFKKMTIESKDNFALWSVDNKLISLTRNQKGALMKALQEATEGAQNKFKRRTVRSLWGNGGGSIGKVATAGISTVFLTLSDRFDIRNFDIGDVCDFAADNGYTATAGTVGVTRQVVGLDEDTGIVQFDQTLVTVPGLAAGFFVFIDGDYGAVMNGVPSYITSSAPGVSGIPTSIHGMLRTTWPQRLAGHRFAGDQNQIPEEILNALTEAFVRNCKTSDIFMRPNIFNEFAQGLESQRQRPSEEKIGRVGYTGIEVTSQSGKTVKCWGDPSIRLLPSGAEPVYGLNMDGWLLHSAEEYPQWLTADEKKFMTEENANAKEGRVGGYAEAYTNKPGENWLLGLT
jgi:hypothetical protein